MQILIYSLNLNPLKLTFNFSPTAQPTLSISNDHGSFSLLTGFWGLAAMNRNVTWTIIWDQWTQNVQLKSFWDPLVTS